MKFVSLRGQSIEIDGIVNLDAHPDPMTFWGAVNRAPVKVARAIFPNHPKGYVSATKTLAAYAANISAAQSCRLRGDIPAALAYEEICDLLYDGLPEYARW